MLDEPDYRLLLLTHSQQMLIAAQQADWAQLAILEGEFEQLVQHCFKQRDFDPEQDQILVKQLIDQQDQVQILIKKAQKDIQLLMSAEDHNVKAMHSYLAAEKSK